MELKHCVSMHPDKGGDRSNRTFYGIETRVDTLAQTGVEGSNRTFYGIETRE